MNSSLISRIEVEELFGLYTYHLPDKGTLPDAAILYGDNGVGKSTILRLAFHLLSAGRDRGHRSALVAVQFKRLSVILGSGVELRAHRKPDHPGMLALSIHKGAVELASWDYRPNEHATLRYVDDQMELLPEADPLRRARPNRAAVVNKKGERPYLEVLAAHVPAAFILNADRRLDSDSVADPSDEVELRRVMQVGAPRRIHDLVARSREIALTQALSAAARWINRQVFRGANQGSSNVHGVYSRVLQHIVSKTGKSKQPTVETPDNLLTRLSAIEAKSLEYSKYELFAPLTTKEFVAALSVKAPTKRALAVELLAPYVTSLESRLGALSGVFGVVDRFVLTVNSFLQDKTIAFSPGAGFSILNRKRVALTPAQLSSGEQQLLLLLCYVLTARDSASVFMIDEPEISLNIKWQRQLVQSLLDLTERDTTQFLFASHSMELLSQHRQRVVRLISKAS